MSERCLVTGGAGFIGSHLTERLLAEGHEVIVLDDLSQGRREHVPAGASLLVGDIADREACEAACRGVSVVFHLAAMSRAGPSMDLGELCTRVNVVGTQRLLEAARRAGVARFVYSASSTCYGNQAPPQGEDLPPQCLNPYALSKYVGELYCELYSRVHGLSTLSLRYFNVYGPRQPRTGPYALVLGIFLDRAASGEPLEIHGDGSQSRDFIHVRDVVEANLLAWRASARGMAVNVGSGARISVQQLADSISRHQMRGPRRTGDADATQADLKRARTLLGWRPKVSLDDGLRELLATPPPQGAA